MEEDEPKVEKVNVKFNQPIAKTQAPAGAKFAKHKIIVMSGKGGVGKSTVATNLAYTLSKMGYMTGILDLDLSGPSIPKMLGIENKEPSVNEDNRKLIPIQVDTKLVAMSLQYFVPTDKALIWRGSMRYKAIKNFLTGVEWGNLDFLIMDLPPGTGDEPINIVQQIPDADGSVIVSTPQNVATQDVKKSILFSKRVDLPVIGIVENMSGYTCPHCHEVVYIFGKDGAKRLSEELDVKHLGSIPLDPNVVTDGDSGKPSILREETVINKAFNEIAKQVIESLKK